MLGAILYICRIWLIAKIYDFGAIYLNSTYGCFVFDIRLEGECWNYLSRLSFM